MRKENKSIKRIEKREGITLVALVITVIIIIILATVAISFAFGNNGLITRAEDASRMYANDTKYTESSMANVESYISEMITEIEEPKTVEDAMPDSAEDEVYIYERTTQITDASGDKMWIPGGFGIASDSATDIDRGVVITDGTNEFVWIPVSDTDLAEMYSTTTPETAEDTTLAQSSLGEETTTTKIYSKLRVRSGDNSNYIIGVPASSGTKEPDILSDTAEGDASTTASRGINLLKSELGYTGTNTQILKDFAQDMADEYLSIFESTKRYDGFYIGRYELTGTPENPTVQRGQSVLLSATANTWYGLKDACNRVITGEDKYAQSCMIYGNQLDEVMDWLIDTGAKTSDEINVDSSTWGNYSNSSGDAAVEGAGSLQKAGYSDEWSANNIYDLAGNCFELTQEACNMKDAQQEGYGRIGRGRCLFLSRKWWTSI